jgi:hypothetical protein
LLSPVDVILSVATIVQPDLETYALGPAGYSLAVRAPGTGPVSPPPFSGLALIPPRSGRSSSGDNPRG